ncbi:MAG: hypothetical protein Q7U28_14090 [Aquabacterium sp.]|nr:hypothetical protein [Aquabacterium sp.]
MCVSKTRGLTLALILLTMAGHSMAAEPADREQAQLHRLKLQLRQQQQDKDSAVQEVQTQAAADKAALTQSLARVQGDVGTQRRAAESALKRANALAADLATLQKDKADLAAKVTQLQQAITDSQAQAAAQQKAATQAQTEAQTRHAALLGQHTQCRTHNATLYRVGVDLLARYENKGFGEVFTAKEPFLQTARVTLEGVKVQYQDKLDAARVPSITP